MMELGLAVPFIDHESLLSGHSARIRVRTTGSGCPIGSSATTLRP